MEFSEKLQQLRKESGLTQEQIAEKLYVSRTAISKWESGRGYPSIDSLKAVSKLFSVSIDDLLSGDELIHIAEAETKEKISSFRNFVLALLDLAPTLLLFMPLFGQSDDEIIRMVSAIALDTYAYIKIPFIIIIVVTVLTGIVEFVLRNSSNKKWDKRKAIVSMSLSILGTYAFIASPQPYAASYMFGLFIIKGLLLVKYQLGTAKGEV